MLDLAAAFFDHPTATHAKALNGDGARNRAAFRFFKNPQVKLHNLPHAHHEATLGRIDEYPRVLVVQDTTSLNYRTHPSTEWLEPISTRTADASGLRLHDTLALTPEGVPLGLVDIQVWARDPRHIGKAEQRKELLIEEKESQRWLNSYCRTAELQRLCSKSQLINLADREADIFELFQEQNRTPDGPDLLIRASRTTRRQVLDENEIQPLWDYVPERPLDGGLRLSIPRRGCEGFVITVGKDGKQNEIQVDRIFSTIPVPILCRLPDPPAPVEVLDAASALEFRAMILIYLVLEQDQFTEYDAHYFPETEFTFTRLSEPKNYSASDLPEARTVLCAELPCSEADPVWSQSDHELGELVKESLARAGLPIQCEVSHVEVRRIPHAYPLYRVGYEKPFEIIDRWLDTQEGVLTFGRQGLYAHDNTHHAMYMAQSASQCLRDDGSFDRDLWHQQREIFKTHRVED